MGVYNEPADSGFYVTINEISFELRMETISNSLIAELKVPDPFRPEIFRHFFRYYSSSITRSRCVGAFDSYTKPMLQTDLFLVDLFFCERKAVPVQ